MKQEVALTKEGKEALEAELKSLIDNRPAIIEKIQTAREFGDLSENEEYSSARAEQKLAESRIQQIQNILKNVKIVKPSKGSTISLGSTVVVEVKGKQYTYHIVGTVEADPLKGKISNESPVGKALFGRKAGEEYPLPNGQSGKIIEVK